MEKLHHENHLTETLLARLKSHSLCDTFDNNKTETVSTLHHSRNTDKTGGGRMFVVNNVPHKGRNRKFW